MSKETEEVEEELCVFSPAVKRGIPFCTGQLCTGFLSYVYMFVSTVQVYCVPIYNPTCLGQLSTCVRSTVRGFLGIVLHG